MSAPQTPWIWEKLPTEILKQSILARGVPSTLPVERKPFVCPRVELGEGLSYQLALASHMSHNAKLLHKIHPEVPLSGDQRSGVILYDGDNIIGSLVLGSTWSSTVSVLPKYRDLGHAQRMFEIWYKNVRIVYEDGHMNVVNAGGLGAFLAAHEGAVKSALAADAPVPKSVWRSIETGSDADKLFSRMKKELRR